MLNSRQTASTSSPTFFQQKWYHCIELVILNPKTRKTCGGETILKEVWWWNPKKSLSPDMFFFSLFSDFTSFFLAHNLNSLVFYIFFLAYFLSLLVKTSVGIYSRIPILVKWQSQKYFVTSSFNCNRDPAIPMPVKVGRHKIHLWPPFYQNGDPTINTYWCFNK